MEETKKSDLRQSQKILQAALTCISAKGYAKVSLRNIADEAGVVLSQLNYYYKNKEGLFQEVVKVLSQQYFREIEEKLKKGEAQKEKLAFLVGYFQEMLKNKPEHFKILFDLSSMALWSESLRELLNNLYNNLADLIARHIFPPGAEEGVSGAPTADRSRLMLGAVIGTSIQVMLTDERNGIIDSLADLPVLLE